MKQNFVSINREVGCRGKRLNLFARIRRYKAKKRAKNLIGSNRRGAEATAMPTVGGEDF